MNGTKLGMDTDEIQNSESLEKWLENKPRDWAAIVTTRTSLRVLPQLRKAPHDWHYQHALSSIRAAFFSWTEANFPALKSRSALSGAANASFAATDALSALGNAAFDAADAAFNAAEIWLVADGFVAKTASNAVEAAAKAARHPSEIWESTIKDCKWLDKNAKNPSACRILTRRSLWLGQPPRLWLEDWQDLSQQLSAIDVYYEVWTEWFERRIRGERAAFDIPNDKRRAEDKKILGRLSSMTEQFFWTEGINFVNAEVKRWLDEARARVGPETISIEASGVFDISGTAEAELGQLPLPAQNTNALSFRTDDKGRIVIAAEALVSQLRTDTGARDRHEEAVGEARHALGRCQGNNAAARLTGLLNNYLEAAGESLETAKPSLLVQRGERLRQELARYEATDHMLPPVADDLLLDLKGWQSAHNMMVGLDPVLVGMDTAILGPDRQPSLIPPDEIRQKSAAADEAGILADEVIEVLIEAADLAPVVPDANNRLTVLSNEMMRNLFIEAFSIALNHPVGTGTVVAVGAMLSSGVVAGVVGSVSIMGSIKAAEYLVNHREWILDRLGNTPTWQALITKLADWLEEVTPFERK